MRSTVLLWLSIEECRTTWESLESFHGLEVDNITKEHTSLPRNALYIFMGMKDDLQFANEQAKEHFRLK